MPASMMRAYHMDHNRAPVNNGGHAQFIRNTGTDIGFTLADIRAGLEAAGAEAYWLRIDALDVWTETYPDTAAQRTGFEGGIATEIQNLDDRFSRAKATGRCARSSPF